MKTKKEETAEKKAPKTDNHKFSKALITHCREHRYEIPPGDFLDALDDYANGVIPCDLDSQMEDDISDTLEEEEDQSTQVIDYDEQQEDKPKSKAVYSGLRVYHG